MRRATIALLLASSGCLVGGSTRTVTALELRAGVTGLRLVDLDPRARAAVEAGQIRPGATEAELFMSRGQPHLWWNTRIGQNRCRVFVHHSSDPNIADLAVTTCGGRVLGTNQIDPPLPCWRLADVGPRITAAATYFEQRPLDVQWQIVIGLLHRGQAEKDVVIAFGQPHDRGFDEREDGKRAEKLVFLDRSGDAYGLNVTLIDDKIVGWQMPAERVMTPEAQQRRLDAMEKRLTDRIADLERKAIQQHAETVKLFGEVMARQDEMLEKLMRRPSVVAVRRSDGTASASPPVDVTMPPSTNGSAKVSSDVTTSTTKSEPPRSDYFDKRNACFKECERRYQEATKNCQFKFNAKGLSGDHRDAALTLQAQCLSNDAQAPYQACTRRCD